MKFGLKCLSQAPQPLLVPDGKHWRSSSKLPVWIFCDKKCAKISGVINSDRDFPSLEAIIICFLVSALEICERSQGVWNSCWNRVLLQSQHPACHCSRPLAGVKGQLENWSTRLWFATSLPYSFSLAQNAIKKAHRSWFGNQEAVEDISADALTDVVLHCTLLFMRNARSRRARSPSLSRSLRGWLEKMKALLIFIVILLTVLHYETAEHPTTGSCGSFYSVKNNLT